MIKAVDKGLRRLLNMTGIGFYPKQRNKPITFLLFLSVFQAFFVKVYCANCDPVLYEPVSYCANHSLRIGYYASHECGGLHTLTDSDSRPNAEYARLNHPATYLSNGQIRYYEYSAGSHLSIKLSRHAEIYAIALQGSPNALRYYLKSFQMSSKITVQSLNVGQQPTTNEDYYKENGIIKQFVGDMKYTRKFILAHPFLGGEIFIYPLLFHGDRVFRAEVYGCFLGKLTIPSIVGVGHPATFAFLKGQSNNASSYQYYLHVTEPNGTLNLLPMSPNASYAFLSRGMSTVKLGMKFSTGWISADEASVTVQGQIIGLQLKIDQSISPVYKKEEGLYMQFRLSDVEQPYQIKTVSFAFGDSTSCPYNYCMKKFTRGVYTVNGTASNDFYVASQQKTIVACPNSAVTVTYPSEISNSGYSIRYNGAGVPHNFTITFYALWTTTFEVRLNGNLTQTETFSGTGSTNKIIHLPSDLRPPVAYNLVFNYTDFCSEKTSTAVVRVDEEISGLSVRLNQTFKQELIQPVSHYFKDKPVDIYIDVAKGTSLSCTITISDQTSAAHNMAVVQTDKIFLKTFTFESPGDTFPTVTATCQSRLNFANAILPSTQFDFRQIPQPLTNFSVSLSSHVISTIDSLTIKMVLATGNQMNCTVNSTAAGLFATYTANELFSMHRVLADSSKEYTATYSGLAYGPSHLITVTCRNILSEVSSVKSLEVQIRVSSVGIVAPDVSCFGAIITVNSTVAAGKPVTKELLIDSAKQIDYPSSTVKDNSFYVNSTHYGSAGSKLVTVNVWNTVSPAKQAASKSIRVTRNIISLDLGVSFTISSPQGLPDRPYLYVPINEAVTFSALVVPADNGYIYDWSIEGPSAASTSLSVSTFSYTFSSVGSWKIRLVVRGCKHVTIERNLTAVGPISAFSLTTVPTPDTVVNKTTTINAGQPARAHCLELDFGDRSGATKNCINNTGPHVLSCFTLGSICSVDHVYDKKGVFTVNLTATNALFKLKKEVIVTAKTCYNPVINVEGDGVSLDDPGSSSAIANSKTLRSDILKYNISSVTMNCEFSNTYSITWKIFSARNGGSYDDVNRTDSSLLLSNSIFSFSRNNHELTIPCCMLPYGILSISVQVRVSGNDLVQSFQADKVLNTFIGHTTPVAVLDSNTFRLYGFNTMITANASRSYDPDKFAQKLSISWYCRDTNLEPRELSMIASFPLLNHTNDGLSQPVAGCFGSPVGKIDVDEFTNFLQFNSKLLQENHTIEITAIVSNTTSVGIRKSNQSKSFLVLTKETPYLEISCIDNCAERMNPWLRLTLNAQCYGDACEQSPTYTWTLLKDNGTHNTTVEIESKLHSFDYEKDLRMKPNILEPGMKYRLTLRGTGLAGAFYEVAYSFETNRGPSSGTCSLSSTSIVAVFQQLTIDCTGWLDKHLPLLYEMVINDDTTPVTLCALSSAPSCVVYLQDGYKDNSTLHIRIRVYDSLNVYSEVIKELKVYSTSCDSVTFTSPADCAANPLRIGYHGSCGEFHSLQDPNNNPNASFARLNHPAYVNSEYYEYVADQYLEIKLARLAHVHAIALQGSPNALRYYLTSFKVWHQIVKKSTVANQSPVTLQDFYKEDGTVKIYSGDMGLVTKFTFANPFYSDTLRVYPLSFSGLQVFRVELYGCYSAKLNVSKPAVVNTTTTIGFTKLKAPSGRIFYLKITEPNGQSSVQIIQNTTGYTFTSFGKARVELGLQYSDGWLTVDFEDVDVLGPISGLSLLSDGYPLSPYKRTTYKLVHFSVDGISNPSQITSINFKFSDSTTCAHNNCIKTLSHGLYRVNCTVSNGVFQQNLNTNIISCPLTAMNLNYTPIFHKGGIGITYQGLNTSHTMSVHFFALWKTNYKAYFNGLAVANETIAEASGWTTAVIQLPSSILAPSSNTLVFNYTDDCSSSSATETVFTDERIQGLSLEVDQTFKLQLIETVPYIFKSHSVDFRFKIETGTSVACNVSIDELPENATANATPQNAISQTVGVLNKQFNISHTFTSAGSSNINVTCKCWNRLLYPNVELPLRTIHVRRVPEKLSDFSIDVSKRTLNSSETFQLFLFLGKGQDMTCNLTLNSTKITKTYTYDQLLLTETVVNSSKKSYTIDVVANSLTPSLLLNIVCRNQLNEVQANTTVTVVEVRIEGLTFIVDSVLCHGSSMLITRNLTRGSPVYDTVFINGGAVSNTVTLEEDTILSVNHSLYGAAGVKAVSVKSANSANSLQTPTKHTRVIMTITSVHVLVNFTLSSSQGLSQRPDLALPLGDRVNFTAIVTPKAVGYIYNWSIDSAKEDHGNTTWYFSFPSIGSYLFRLSVTGCREVIYERNFTVVSPIDAFEVKTSPSPDCLVHETTFIIITHARHGECFTLDFGDGSRTLTQCKANATLPAWNCFTNGSLCTIPHEYKETTVFTVRVTASNQLFARTATASVTARLCTNPVVSIRGNGTEIAGGFQDLGPSYSAVQHLRSQPISFSIESVTANCYFSQSYSIRWQVYSLDVSSTVNKSLLLTQGQSFLVLNSTISFENNLHILRVPCCTVHYGDLIVSMEVAMEGHYLIGRYKTHKVLAARIRDTELVAELAVKGHKSYAYNTTVTLNASLSHDPDRYSNLTYIWYCRDIHREARNIFSISDLPVIDRKYFMQLQEATPNYVDSANMTNTTMQLNSSTIQPTAQHNNNTGGCFGFSAGILNVSSTTNELSFNSMNLTSNRTYEFSVIVEATNPLRKRRSNTTRTLTALLPLTPVFELKCIDNCKARLDPSHKFRLKAICQSVTCATNASFKWTFEEYNHTARREVELADILYASNDVRSFDMKPNVLTPGSNYSIHVKATASDGSFYEQTYLVSVNIQPLNGTCTVDPMIGEAIYTTFNVNCSQWIDTELPLTYEVAHFNDILTTVVCRHHSPNCQTILPMASNNDLILYIRVRIIDNMGMFSEVYVNVTMRGSSLSVNQLNDALSNLMNITDNMDAARYIGAVVSALNFNAQDNRTAETLTLKIQFRDEATQVLINMVHKASDDVIAPLITRLAEVPNEYSFASGSISTNGLTQMTSALISDEARIIFRDIISRSKSLLAAMAMVMKSTSVNLDPNLKAKNESNVTENPLRWTTPEGRQIVLSNTGSTQSLVSTVLQRMSPAEEPVRIVTENLGIIVERRFGDKMNQTTSTDLMGARMTLPSLEDMNLNKDLTVSSVSKVTMFNSYFWQDTSKLINSSVIEIELKSVSSILSVLNTKQPVQLSIPRQLEHPIPFAHWTFCEKTGEERQNVHTLKIENRNSLHMEFKPANYCLDYEILIKYDSRPSREDFLKNWTLPDLSTCGDEGVQGLIRENICSTYQSVVSELNSYGAVDPEASINCTLRDTLELKVNELVKSCRLFPYRVFISDTETKDGTYFIGVYEKNGTASNRTSSAESLNTTTSCQLIDGVNQTSYFLRSFTSKCRFWNTISEQWETFGCEVGDESTVERIQCKCNHLTSFASDFLVTPNPIDMDKVLEGFKNINDNVSVVVLLSLLFGLFILLVVALRRKDKLDASKVGVVSVHHNPTDSYQYLVITITGARANAGTTANVFCTLNNSEKKGQPRLLIDLEKPAFQRDQINAFIISYNEPIENITDIRIWHNNKGDSPSWYLSRVYIEDLTTNKRYSFICEQWLAVEFEDGLIDRSLGIATEEDDKIFTHIFTTKTAKDFSDEHLWLSLFLKRPHDSFTRVQRVACCMALLSLTMLASAMFFQLGNQSKYLWKLGSLVIDFKGIIIGIQSGFIVIPISAIILAIFRNTESFGQYKKRRQTRNHDGTIAKRSKLLPCGFLVVGWFLAMVAVLGSSVVVLFYSMQWGNEKSQQFVISIFTSFLESAFIIQPFKLILVAMLLAAVFKRNQEDTGVLEMYKLSSNVQNVNLKDSGIKMSNIEPKPLTEKQQESARNRRFMEIRLRLFLQELVSYMIFLMFLVFVVRGYRDNDEYYFSKSLRDDVVHGHFEKVQDIPGIWTWAQNHFIPAIYTKNWYNGDNFTNFKMTRNQEAYRLGLARIRQLRVKPNTCKVPDDTKGISSWCNAAYSFEENDERDFDIGWKNLSNVNRRRRQIEEQSDNLVDMVREEEDSRAKHSGMNEYDGQDDVMSRHIDIEYSDQTFGPSETDVLETRSQLMTPVTDGYTESERVLRRSRRALKLKIKRKTSSSSLSSAHEEDISVDEQYLLPNGQIRPNKEHWLYHDMSSLRGFPYYGHFATYSGGGYVASLSTDIDFARATAMALEQDSWIDILTRAVFFEFSVYNANMNFFATGFVIIEILPTGSVVPNANIRVFKLYRYVGAFGRLVMASEIILVLCLFFFIYKECRHMYRLGCSYFRQFWSWVEITIAIALFTALILRGFSWYEGDKNLIALRQNMHQFINFHYTVVADDALLTAVMVICFLSTLKLIKVIQVFPTIESLKGTLRRCVNPLLNYALPFTVAFCAFSTLSHLIFYETDLFMSYLKTAETQLMMLIGGSVFTTLHNAHPTLGPIFFFMFACFETFILLNVFLTIINEGISDSAHWGGEAKANEFFEFMEERVNLMLRAFSDSLQKTASKVPFGFQKIEQVIEASQVDEGKSREAIRTGSAEDCDLIITKLENKLSDNFQIDSHDMKYFLTLLMGLKRRRNVVKQIDNQLKDIGKEPTVIERY